ncbi:MAG: hypothetical protein WC796_00610 [Candidatus Pacearchaeota archaeon]|jgi:hypothetical protein
MRRKNNLKLVLFIFAIVVLSSLALAESNNTSAIEKNAKDCVEKSREILLELQTGGFSIQRVNDTFVQAESLLNAQLILKVNKKITDFSQIASYCDEIVGIREKALNTRDEFSALKRFYNDSLTKFMNTSEIDQVIYKIDDEIKNERYELAVPMISEAYDKITSLKASQTTLKIFYDSTTLSIRKIVYDNVYYILSLLIVIIILFFVYRIPVKRRIIRRKIDNLEKRKKVIKSLIMNTQNDYFNHNKIAESVYNIRTKKFAELIRDIDRQIPLLNEELFKIKKDNNTKSKKVFKQIKHNKR